ncbi:GNAT family N-acetyltransferase [Candidatus Bathyarchaeota archaeon]|nr:GNAT family N-acetyltransferase [Candidatus Bathyarchaeota archaeon]
MDRTVKSIKIRSANEKDSLSLVILAEEFMPREVDKEKRVNVLKQALRNLNYELLVAELEGEIVGFIDQWVIHDFTHGAKHSYILNLYVSSKHRSKGIASKLLQEAMENARSIEVSEIHVTARFDNRLAINLYKKHGLVKEHLQLEKEFK